MNFKTKGTAMHNGPRSRTNKLDWENLAEMFFLYFFQFERKSYSSPSSVALKTKKHK